MTQTKGKTRCPWLLGRARLPKAGPARVCGKSKMSALDAAMRKLVHLCFGVLKTLPA